MAWHNVKAYGGWCYQNGGLAGISYCLMWILLMWWRPNFAWLCGTTAMLVLDPIVFSSLMIMTSWYTCCWNTAKFLSLAAQQLSQWQLPVQPVMKILSKGRKFCLSVRLRLIDHGWHISTMYIPLVSQHLYTGIEMDPAIIIVIQKWNWDESRAPTAPCMLWSTAAFSRSTGGDEACIHDIKALD